MGQHAPHTARGRPFVRPASARASGGFANGMALAALAAATLLAAPAPARAQAATPLTPPGLATLADESRAAAASLALPTGPWQGADTPIISATGARLDQVWHVAGGGHTPDDLLAPLRRTLAEEGYDLLYECADTACGGFDFRYGLDLAPEPLMHVDLGAYRYLAARRASDAQGVAEHVRILASHSARTGFVQISRAGPAGLIAQGGPGAPRASSKSPDPAGLAAALAEATGPLSGPLSGPAEGIGAQLARTGRVVLGNVTFAPGAMAPGAEADATLADLARWLAEDPARRIALVGHTDNEGPLSGNVTLSRARAEAVRSRLIAEFGAHPRQITAEGVGWLAPLGPNDTPETRARNRRVEAVLATAGR